MHSTGHEKCMSHVPLYACIVGLYQGTFMSLRIQGGIWVARTYMQVPA
jgi:hypothetical protein